jgi:hypothetical protein
MNQPMTACAGMILLTVSDRRPSCSLSSGPYSRPVRQSTHGADATLYQTLRETPQRGQLDGALENEESAQEDALSVVVPRASEGGLWQCFYADSAWFPRRGSTTRALSSQNPYKNPCPASPRERPDAADASRKKEHKI